MQGYEAPYGRAQFVLEYDSAKVPNPPKNFAELKDWVKKNPGKFTYPKPPDFTGSAFIRQAFYAVTGGHRQYMAGFDKELYGRNSGAAVGLSQRAEAPSLAAGQDLSQGYRRPRQPL